MTDERQFLLNHSAHSYDDLIRRWKAVAEAANLTMKPFASAGEFTIYGLHSQSFQDGSIYLSAGVHGDEPAATLGLIAWAESNPDFLAQASLLISPCLNPWGLVHNQRHTAQNLDLNRRFGDSTDPIIQAWSEFYGDTVFELGLCLHEDYDARGCYIYELSQPGPSLGEICLDAVTPIIPRDPTGSIEGRDAANALIRHEDDLHELAAEIARDEGGLPEAIQLILQGTQNSLTFETPSEYSLFTRVTAQVRFIETAIQTAQSRRAL